MTKTCLGYVVDGKVLCRPCALDRFDTRGDADTARELHTEAKGLSCSACRRSLGEKEDE